MLWVRFEAAGRITVHNVFLVSLNELGKDTLKQNFRLKKTLMYITTAWLFPDFE
jgi:hypothetical protein